VQDTGLGIPQSDLPHVFDKYYQASTKATGGEPGTGLGLAIVRELVLLHGGRIDVESAMNRGTTFTVYLPSRPDKDASVHAGRID
jgi:two-component system sensor histidine kinase ResE